MIAMTFTIELDTGLSYAFCSLGGPSDRMTNAGTTLRSRSETADSGGQRSSRGPICSIGFLNPSRLRGRSLSSAPTQSRSSAL